MRNFLPFLIILFLIAAFLRFEFFLTVAYLFCAVYVLAHFWVRYAAEGVRVQRRFVNRAFPGDQVVVDLMVREARWLPVPWLQLDEGLPLQLTGAPFRAQVISLGPREQRHITYTLECRRRGYYAIGPLRLRTGDLLGITRQSRVQSALDHIIVYPHVLPLHKLGLPTHSPLAVLPAKSPLFEDVTRVRGMRDYQQGDSLRHIHWTASASAGRLLVKRYQPAIARETLICLDLNEESYAHSRRYTATELAIVVAASIANHIIVNEKLAAGLATEAMDPLSGERTRFFLPPRAERAHLMGLLEILARAQVTSALPLAELLRRESVRVSWGATLAVVTGRSSAELIETLLYLRRAGFAVALVLIDPVSKDEATLHLPGVPVYRVWRESDLESWQ
jgi:uncharacterized protein (DUF58 family)